MWFQPNLFYLKSKSNDKGGIKMTSFKTQLSRKFRGSAYLEVKNVGVILPGESEFLVIDQRFYPYDDIVLFNASRNSDAEITVNYNQTFFLPQKNNLKDIAKMEFMKITNLGSVNIAIGEIKMMYRNSGYKGQEILSNASKIISGAGFLKILGSR